MPPGFIRKVEYISDANGYRIVSNQQIQIEKSDRLMAAINTILPMRPVTSSPWNAQLARSPSYKVYWTQSIPMRLATTRATSSATARPTLTALIATTKATTKLTKTTTITSTATSSQTSDIDVPVEYKIDYR